MLPAASTPTPPVRPAPPARRPAAAPAELAGPPARSSAWSWCWRRSRSAPPWSAGPTPPTDVRREPPARARAAPDRRRPARRAGPARGQAARYLAADRAACRPARSSSAASRPASWCPRRPSATERPVTVAAGRRAGVGQRRSTGCAPAPWSTSGSPPRATDAADLRRAGAWSSGGRGGAPSAPAAGVLSELDRRDRPAAARRRPGGPGALGRRQRRPDRPSCRCRARCRGAVRDRVPAGPDRGHRAWEAALVSGLERVGGEVVVVRRCVDLADLLAGRGHRSGAGRRRLGRPAPARRRGAGPAGVGAASRSSGWSTRATRRPSAGCASSASARCCAADAAGRARSPRRSPGPCGRRRAPSRPAEARATAAPPACWLTRPRCAARRRTATGAGRPSRGGVEAAVRPGRWSRCGGRPARPGRTTVAVDLAAELPPPGHATLLADADTYGGSVAQALGLLDEAPGLAAAARAADHGRSTWTGWPARRRRGCRACGC